MEEPDSQYFLQLAGRSSGPLWTSDIAREEVLSALYRKEDAGDIKPDAAALLFEAFLEDEAERRIVVVPNGRDVLRKAQAVVTLVYEQKPRLMIRSLDLIHVASALAIRATALVATDDRLRKVAERVGLELLPLDRNGASLG